MFNYIIGAILIYALIAGTKLSDYKFRLSEIPWLILVVAGFTISFLGLFKFNDERVIFGGCAVLLAAKVFTWIELKKTTPVKGASNAKNI